MTTLSDLAARITLHAKLLDEHLQSNNLPTPSFSIDAPPDFPNPDKDPRVEAARVALIEDTQTLRNLALGPGQVVRQVGWSIIDLSTQHTLLTLHIPSLIPLTPTGIPYTTLSTLTHLPPQTLKLLLRQSATAGLFHEPSPNHIAHTASSAVLVRDGPLGDWFAHHLEEVFPAALKLAMVVGGSKGVVTESKMEGEGGGKKGMGNSAFSLAFGIEDGFWDFLERNPDRQRRFLGAMEAVGGDGGHSLRFVVEGFQWGSVGEGEGEGKGEGKGVVVDVGGSAGFLSATLAQTYPKLHFIVQDYAHTVESGRSQLPPSLQDRVSFMAHDFFTPQPVSADVYLLRHVCHNWSDGDAARILGNIVPAMKEGSRIVLVEVVVVEPGVVGGVQERYMRNVDVNMFQMLNTQERGVEDWERVVKQADARLEVKGINQPEGSWDSIIEIGFE
ncbi:O-methyltransferase [Aspergillus sclerotiicarbonarius CBS 121057]|uniref:O-methyltransferase n=1 Tax=Aspergillus sclerotiicarbonarius (strain CBS 121057 / IBT 28362) TaxID=1448318 RepID=A0A319EIP4_ASPSB|nr:O-methyltransferase [Aspergillus sclerotiicarbonarius CBS 121057]